MAVKDRIVTWFIKNIVVPRREIIDKPGFIVTTFTEHSTHTYLRELLIPEQLFELIENKIIRELGDIGKQTLYSAGKKFGYLYASMSNFPRIDKHGSKQIIDFAYSLVRYNECMYARLANHSVDIGKKTFSINFDEYVICRHNGYGYILADGGIAGTWAYALQDETIEGVQLQCQGRGDKKCLVLCAPQSYLEKQKYSALYEIDLPEYTFDNTYKNLNEIRPTVFPSKSFKQLLNAGFFKYNHGILTYKDSRFFLCESHILYLLEEEVSKLRNADNVLFDACFEYGQKLQETYGHDDYKKFIPDFFSALGYGDIRIYEDNGLRIGINFYPWTIYSNNSKYIILRGMLSGFISKALGKEIVFKNTKIQTKNYLTLTLDLTQQQ
jgi:predicted hydrocarbon binding protein